jgi:1,4-alpha-glucan branching enzyme
MGGGHSVPKDPKKPGAAKSSAVPVEPDAATIAAVVAGTHADPFAVLGLHGSGKLVARAFVDGAEELEAFTLADKPAGTLVRNHDAGFFSGALSIRKRQPLKYHARNAGGDWWVIDPYSFGPVLGPMDDYYIAEGSHLARR